MRREVVPQEPERFNHVYGAGSASASASNTSSSYGCAARKSYTYVLRRVRSIDEDDGVTEHAASKVTS